MNIYKRHQLQYQDFFNLFKENLRKIDFNYLLQRVFDIVFSVVVLIIVAPIMIIIAFLIKVNSPDGNILFKQKRIGLKGRPFYIYKFRTMIPNAESVLESLLNSNSSLKEEFQKTYKLKNDPRIIPNIGNFLRKTSLDELPQFFNVIMGDMSVVGPRPVVEKELREYGKYTNKFLSVKSGVTGLWQVSGRNDIDYHERIALDMIYIDKKSFLLDLKIIFKTISVMILGKGM